MHVRPDDDPYEHEVHGHAADYGGVSSGRDELGWPDQDDRDDLADVDRHVEQVQRDETRATLRAAAKRLGVAERDVPGPEYAAQSTWRTWARWTGQMPLRHLLTLPPERHPVESDAWCVGGAIGGDPPYDAALVRRDGSIGIGVLTDVDQILSLLADYLDMPIEHLEALVDHPVPPPWSSWAGIGRPS